MAMPPASIPAAATTTLTMSLTGAKAAKSNIAIIVAATARLSVRGRGAQTRARIGQSSSMGGGMDPLSGTFARFGITTMPPSLTYQRFLSASRS